MSIKEVFFYRIFQLLNVKFFYRLKLKYFKPSLIEVNPNFKGPKYSIKEIQNLFEQFPWSNEYSYFNTKVNLSSSLNWRKDYKNHQISEKKYSGSIYKQDFKKNGDVKYISELSRLHFLPFLVFKNIVDNDFKPVSDILYKWEEDNSFMGSINYASGIEVAIRSVNLIYAHHILNSFNFLSKEIDKLIKKLISQNYFFLKNHLSLFSSSNNHLIAELTGLTVISSYFIGKKISNKKWKQILVEKITTKYLEDGMDDELSMRYHLAVSDHFINSLEFIKNSDFKISKDNNQLLIKIRDFTSHINYFDTDSNFGDNDNSFLINPFFDKEFCYSKSIVESLNIITESHRDNEKVDFRNYLIFGEPFLNSKYKSNSLIEKKSSVFKDSGYAFLYDNISNIKLTFDIGDIGDDRLMAHGHSDQLSFTLQKEKHEILVDPGTYQYHESKNKWRQYFRSIRAHNCISFNGMNHALSLGRMSWISSSKVIESDFSLSDKVDKVLGKTNAFISQGLDYSREIILNKEENKIIINDLLNYSKQNNGIGSFYLHFHPNVLIKHEQDVIKMKIPSGDLVELKNQIFKSAKLIEGGEDEPFGWYSKKYDRKQKSFSLISEFIVKKDVIITTEIFY